MASTIMVNTGTINNKVSELKNLNSSLKKQIENLTTTESSLNGMWEGEAKEAFHKAFASDLTQMNQFYSAVEKYIGSLERIVKAYETAEKTNAATAAARKY